MNQINQEDIEAKENEKSDLKCLHYRDNPLQWKIIRYQEEFKRLTEENKKLLVRIDLLKQGNDDVTRIVDDEMSKSEMVQSLQAELLLTKKKQQTIMEAYKKASKDLRRIVYLLTGYRYVQRKSTDTCIPKVFYWFNLIRFTFDGDRFDAFKNGVYKLTHMLTSGQNCFMFTMDEEEVVNMLETPFSVQFQDLMTQYLLQYDSFPAFLSAVTIRLLEQKQIADVSTA